MSKNSVSHSSLDPGISQPPQHAIVPKTDLGNALRAVRPNVRSILGISDVAIAIVECVIVMARRLSDEDDPRPWSERFEDIATLLPDPDSIDADGFEQSLKRLSDGGIERWAKRLESVGGRLFLRRLLGAASYDRIVSALRAEGRELVIAVRKGFRSLMPTIVALQDCCAHLAPEDFEAVEGFSSVQNSMIGVALAIDGMLEQLLVSGFDFSELKMPENLESLAAEAEDLVSSLRLLVTEMSQDEILDLSAPLARKINGARDALEHSADGVSQGANSLVEFVDRLLRTAFENDFVIEWIARNYPSLQITSYTKNGKTVPTKRAQALCFVHGGREIQAPSPFHELAAAGLVETRSNLEKLKHADIGTDEERELMGELIHSVEGFFMFAIRAGWAGLDGERKAILKSRFQQAA